ncbi:LysR family transcriptional regulator [Alteromonas sp. ASW11-19]|uniref:LysR family transcriptional regulator n=1 Tax=Alteromonas salexigens TaxID=2982530 RepID=A0ABT2VJX1_9ALTE|nr:LysR family transcriptional regulator [Alteromonas salexigens]MCU7553429.1 LysR family transcriptional regulator [Alteromonas salexigens]
MKINPVWLQTFRVLADTGSFTKTATTLFMTQPGVSQHIKKLEEVCGYSLLNRYGKRFDLTRQGDLLYRHALAVAEEEKKLLQALGEDDPVSGDCRIACSGSTALRIYRHLLGHQAEHPGLTMQLQAAPYQSILSAIAQGDIDLGVVTEKPDALQFTAKKIGRESIAIIVPANRPQGAQLLPDYLQQLGIIRHPDSDYYTRLYLDHSESDTLRSVAFQTLPTRGFVNQIHDILLPVSQGLGFAVLPYSVLVASPYRDRLSVMSNIPLIAETLYLVYRKNRQLPARFDAIMSLLGEHLADDGHHSTGTAVT